MAKKSMSREDKKIAKIERTNEKMERVDEALGTASKYSQRALLTTGAISLGASLLFVLSGDAPERIQERYEAVNNFMAGTAFGAGIVAAVDGAILAGIAMARQSIYNRANKNIQKIEDIKSSQINNDKSGVHVKKEPVQEEVFVERAQVMPTVTEEPQEEKLSDTDWLKAYFAEREAATAREAKIADLRGENNNTPIAEANRVNDLELLKVKCELGIDLTGTSGDTLTENFSNSATTNTTELGLEE